MLNPKFQVIVLKYYKHTFLERKQCMKLKICVLKTDLSSIILKGKCFDSFVVLEQTFHVLFPSYVLQSSQISSYLINRHNNINKLIQIKQFT